ncbi:baseplate J protein [Pseudomonas phage Dolphis]|nr:baseplate J protein [Pseudomonas phage Dolphis]
MAFQIKDFVSIVASMINHMRGNQSKITDFQPGSVSRTLVEGPAVELEELYLQMFIGLREAIPVATFQSFGFDKLPASYASGYVSISKAVAPTEPMVIPAGTIFTSQDGRTYTSTNPVTWAAGAAVVTVPVVSNTVGLAGNIAAGLITSSGSFSSDYTISNSAINNGTDAENDSEREARFAEFIGSLSRGTTIACLYAARQASTRDDAGNILEYVTRAGVKEIAGYVRIFLYSSLGIPTAALLANGQQLIDGQADAETGEPLVEGFRAAGIRVDLLPMTERAISMGIGVKMRAGYALTNAVRQAITDTYALSIRNIQPGETLLIDNLRAVLLGTANVSELSLSSTQNITCDRSEALIPGQLTITTL